MYCKGITLTFVKKKKKIFVFSAARFIISEWLMTRNYPDIITYVFLKKAGRYIIDLLDQKGIQND
jgi:membrane-bound acyltransferase YfiQ involved in biofilm formation